MHWMETKPIGLPSLNSRPRSLMILLRIMSTWNDTIHFCHWRGVTCSQRHQRVTMLQLQSLELAGSISPHVGNLSFLNVLQLENNSFSDQIPPQLGFLRRLQTLHLYNNSITGKIPSNLSHCSSLISLSIAFNKLQGEIPAALGSLSKLQHISIDMNNLTGNIPYSFGNLSSLQTLSSSLNKLNGNIPASFGQLKNLARLGLTSNRLSGVIPPSLFNPSALLFLMVGDNQLQGSLPSYLGFSLPNLRYLHIGFNQISGSIPISISNASNLQQLSTARNRLTGKVPTFEKLNMLRILSISTNYLGSREEGDLSFLTSLSNATTLEMIAVQNNNFGGSLPEYISNLSSTVSVISLGNNSISGSIPFQIGNLVNLEVFDIWGNGISGNIPPSIGKLQNLVQLYLDENVLTGDIPQSLGNLTMLNELLLGGNHLQGSIPSSLGNCKNLRTLNLSVNNLTGTVPPEVMSLTSLTIALDLSGNNLFGALPVEVGILRSLGYLDVADNMLSGDIPSSLGNCIGLETLKMQGNFFQGSIPPTFNSLRGIRILDLSRNNLSGKVPEFFGNFGSMQILNLSYNNFEGNLPIGGAFTNASISLVMGNSKLCGGIPEFQLPRCDFEAPKKRGLALSLKLVISTFSGVLVLTSVVVICWLKRKRKQPASTTSTDLLMNVSYQSLLKATDGFSTANLIGVGSFGTVYKGILNGSGTIVAVKVLNLLRHGASRSFIAECEALRNIRHRNLIKILTVCSSVDYHGNDFKALVYEFMANGSLEDWLHAASKKLGLLQRLNIAIDVGCALEYLHRFCETPIVHCDLKPSNVLLDDQMTAHVSDFGLAKILSEDTFTYQSTSIGVRGTIGYAPPEYGMGSEVSTYGDVYSYGILLLELFTGKRPTDGMFKEGFNLHNFVKAAMVEPERVAEFADPTLLRDRIEQNTSTHSSHGHCNTLNHVILECLISVFGIAVACSAELPTERMDISDAVVKLCSIRDKLLETQ